MTDLKVLHCASSDEAFFDQQVDALEDAGVECTKLVVPAGTATSRGVREYLDFYRALLSQRRKEFDLVHANYGLIGPLALAQPVRPVVLTIWGSEVMGYSRRLDWLTRFAAKRSDAVIAPTRVVSRQLDCEHRIVHFGVDLDRFRPIPRAEARSKLGWSTTDRVVLFPYDPDRTVKRFALAKQAVEKADIPAELRVVNGVPYEKMPYVYNASDVVLITSARESGPMVVREAAACNVPVVSTDVGFVRETLDGVSNSVVVSDRHCLFAALEDILKSGNRSDGRVAVNEFSIARMTDQLLDIYADVLGLSSPKDAESR